MNSRTFSAAFACALAALTLSAPALAGSPMVVGAAEDAGKSVDPVVAKAKMDLARLAGLNAIRMTAIWSPGQAAPAATELLALQNAAAAAKLDGIRLIVSVYHYGARTTPRTPAGQTQFAQFAASIARAAPTITDFIVGNEPNLNRFWMPQFNRNGSDAAAPAYEALLARTYDALKAVSPAINVIGGSVSPRGQDKMRSKRQTHSPTTFIPDLGRAYRASGRTKPIMDSFAFHPYLEYSRIAPTFRHPKSSTVALADYRKLVALLGKAFDGTAQLGSKLPILYDEFGIQSRVPPAKQSVYSNLSVPSGADAVDESVQGAYYRQALAIAFCQPTVMGFLIFHVTDEADLDRWQSGLYYADDTPKSSFAVVKGAADEVRAGTIARCGSTRSAAGRHRG